MTELKPCPFCGSEVKIQSKGTSYSLEYFFEAQCTRKGCYFGVGVDYNFDTTEEAITKWNQSYTRQPDPELLEALEKIASGKADQLCNDGIKRSSSLTYMQLTLIALETLARYKEKSND